jgi:outer membrane protein TolC
METPADVPALAEARAERASRPAPGWAAPRRHCSWPGLSGVRDVTVGLLTSHSPMDTGPSVGVTLSVPLFVNNYFDADIRRAAADLDTARFALDKVLQSARGDLQRAELALASAAERERRIREGIVPLARRAAEAVEFAFTRGAATVLDVLDARRQLRAAELDGIAALSDLHKARATLALLDPRHVPIDPAMPEAATSAPRTPR